MVMGENGIFGKANNAKNKTEVAQYEEELRMCVLELQTDAATNGTTFNMETIKNKFVEKVKELENTTEIEFPTGKSETRLDGTYKGYEFYIDDKYAAHIGDKATGISLTTSINPSGWTQGPVTATITIKSNNGINKVEPDEGSKNGNEYIITKENIAENKSFEYTVTDGQGNTQTKTAVINTIDRNPPADFTIAAENTEEGLKITGEATDAESGIDKYEYYVMKSTDSDYTKYDNNPITGLASGIYNVYVIAYDKAGNKKQSTNTVENIKISAIYKNITAQMVAEHPELYYGLKVINYTSQNGQNDWKIFYSDWKEKSIEQNTNNPTDTHIFLITGDYINPGEKDKIDIEATGISTLGYNVMWNPAPNSQMNLISLKIKSRFKAKEYDSKDENIRCVSTLLNTYNWKKYLDTESETGNAEYVIGSPTVNMWVDSWNTRYPDDIVESFSIDESVMKKKKGYKNKLYYPQTSVYNEAYGYWFASSSAKEIRFVSYTGSLSDSLYYGAFCGLRPVVSLKSEITVNAEDAQ